jgi:ribosome-binding factor A
VSRRTERLSEEIREEVALLIASELKDPRIGFVTVTRVEVTPDLRTARIYVGVLGTEKQRTTSLAGLKQGAGFLRRALGRTLRLRYTPELLFQYDEGLEASDRVAKLLAEIGSSPTAAPENPEDDDE